MLPLLILEAMEGTSDVILTKFILENAFAKGLGDGGDGSELSTEDSTHTRSARTFPFDPGTFKRCNSSLINLQKESESNAVLNAFSLIIGDVINVSKMRAI